MHVDLVPLGPASANDGCEAILQRPLGHVVRLDGARVARAAAGPIDAGGAHDGGSHTAGVGGEDDLVHGAVDGVVGQRGDLGHVGDVVVFFVWVGGFAVALFAEVALLFTWLVFLSVCVKGWVYFCVCESE